MKKLIVLTLVLLLGMSACALAEGGVRVEIGGAFSIERPADLEEIELTDDDALEGMVYAATNDELEIYVHLCDLEGQTREELYGMYQEDEFLENVTTGEAGGIEYLSYRAEEELGVVFVISGEQYYEIVFYCVTDDALTQAQDVLDSMIKL